MEIKTAVIEVAASAKITNATVVMQSGDHLSVGVEVDGVWQTININVQGRVIMVQHEQSQDAVLITPSGNQFVKG